MKRLSILLAVILALASSCQGQVRYYGVKVVREYPHDRSSYTQGLFFQDGTLYESTGQYGESTMRIVDLETGEATRKLAFNRQYFVEGSSIIGDDLYILTWTNRIAFVYDAQTLEYKSSYSYPRQGWGLTTDGRQLIASDGSSKLYFLDETLQVQRTVDVKLNGRPMQMLNELEWIDGRIWANVYTTDILLIINPANGVVEATVDCTGLLPRSVRSGREDVLNGIAYNPADGKIFLTGKYWPRMYEIELVEKR